VNKIAKEGLWLFRYFAVVAGFVIIALEAWKIIEYPLEIMITIIFLMLAIERDER
jgi:hypothetical protein